MYKKSFNDEAAFNNGCQAYEVPPLCFSYVKTYPNVTVNQKRAVFIHPGGVYVDKVKLVF